MRGLPTGGATSPAKRAGRIATGTGPHPDCCRSFRAARPAMNLLTRHRHLVLLSVVVNMTVFLVNERTAPRHGMV